MRVDFGGTPATIVAISNTPIMVSTPRRTLASPDVPGDRRRHRDRSRQPGSALRARRERLRYTAPALTPTIYSVSPTTGPNDASTRVSIFGTGFQFPMQVFMTGGSLRRAARRGPVSDISLSTIVFRRRSRCSNVCLTNQLVDIVIMNPTTGKGTSCPACFKYYSCPTITSIGPGFGPYTGGTQVVITGHNFEEPVAVDGGGTAWQPISVSSEQIIAVTPPLIV